MSRRLTVGDVLKALHGVLPSTEVLVPTGDHAYRPANLKVTSAMRDGPDRHEDHGEDLTPEGPWGARIPAVVIE